MGWRTLRERHFPVRLNDLEDAEDKAFASVRGWGIIRRGDGRKAIDVQGTIVLVGLTHEQREQFEESLN